MALEAVVFSQDPLTSYNCYKEYYNLFSTSNNFGVGVGSGSSWSYDFSNYANNTSNNNYDHSKTNTFPSEIIQNDHVITDQQWDQQQYVNNTVNSCYSSSPGGHCTMEQYLSGEAPPPVAPGSPAAGGGGSGGRRKRRRRSCKNKEEVEQQRMTHIAVERNRRKQMNDYLSVIRSLMPPSYAQRGDQASIVGGAINYVKELEQLLHSLEGHKRTKHHHQEQQQRRRRRQRQEQSQEESGTGEISAIDDDLASSESDGPTALFADIFTFPQYSSRSTLTTITTTTTTTTSQLPSGGNSLAARSGSGNSSSVAAAGEIEVTMVDSHANVKMLTKKQPKQLVRLVAGFQGLRLSVLHLNVTTVDSFVLYSFSVKIEEGCQLNSVDDIAAASNHILTQIQEDSAATLL